MNDKVLATVNGKDITDADLERVITRYPTEKRIFFETAQGRKQLLEQKVAFSVFGLYAEDMGMDKTEEFLAKISDIKEQMLTQTVMRELFSGITTTDEEAMDFYNNNPDKFTAEETVRVKHILTEDEDTALKIRKELAEGTLEFEAAAEKYSICPSKEKGGDLGYFKRGMMVKEFEDAAYSLEPGALSELVKTQFGYHIMIVTDKTPKRQIPFDEVSEQLKAQLQNEKQQKVYEEKLDELKEKYGVSIQSE